VWWWQAHASDARLACTHLNGVQAVQVQVIDKVCRGVDLGALHLLKVLDDVDDALSHLLAVQEGLRGD